MKKNIFLLSLFLLIFSCALTIIPFDTISIYRLTTYPRAYETTGHLKASFSIADSSYDFDTKYFFETMDKLATENHLVVFCAKQNGKNTQDCYDLYLSSNDIYIDNWLLLEGETHVDLSGNNQYVIKAEDRKYRISNFIPLASLSLSNLKNCNQISGIYILFNLEGDIKVNATKFIEQLQDEVGKFSYVDCGTSTFYDTYSDLDYIGGVTKDVKLKIAGIIIFTLLLCSKIFSMTREISVHKIEGENAFSIYWSMFLQYLIKYSLLDLFFFFICLFIYFFGGVNSFRVFSDLFLLEYVQVFGIEIVLSVILYLIIRFVPIVSSFKGESKMNFVEQLAYITKMISVFILLPYVITSFVQAKDLVIMASRHKHVLNTLENYYQFGNNLTSRYSLDIGQNSYIAVRNEFVQETNGFGFNKSYWSAELQTPNATNLDWFYSISWSYIRNNNLLDNDDWKNDAVVFMTPGVTYTEGEIEWNIFTSLGDEKEVHFIYIDYYPNTLSFSELLKQDKVSSYPLVYTPDLYGYEGQMNDYIFYYEGTLEEATNLANKAFTDNGYTPALQVDSMKKTYESYYQSIIKSYLKQTFLFIASMIALAFTNRFLIQSDIDCNSQRYRVAYTEGVQPYGLLTYILKIASPTILALIACILSKRITGLNNVIYNILFIFIFEISLYLYYLHYYRKVVHK